MADFSEKLITKLKTGDLILSTDSYGNIDITEVITIMQYGENLGNQFYLTLKYKLIFYFPFNGLAKFFEILTETGHSITLSGNHLIYEKKKGYLKAEYIKLNDELQVLMTNNRSLDFSKVILIKEKVEYGFIAPLVESGNLMVDGIHASCYAGINSHLLADLALKPLIYWHKINKFLNFEQIELENLQKTSYRHPYVDIFYYLKLKKLANIII